MLNKNTFLKNKNIFKNISNQIFYQKMEPYMYNRISYADWIKFYGQKIIHKKKYIKISLSISLFQLESKKSNSLYI